MEVLEARDGLGLIRICRWDLEGIAHHNTNTELVLERGNLFNENMLGRLVQIKICSHHMYSKTKDSSVNYRV